jgi:hypothetical protein
MHGRMTVDQGLCNDRKIPAFLKEQMIAFSSRLPVSRQLKTACDSAPASSTRWQAL